MSGTVPDTFLRLHLSAPDTFLRPIAAARDKGKRIGGRKSGARGERTRLVKSAVLALQREGKGVSEIAGATGLSRPTVYRLIG